MSNTEELLNALINGTDIEDFIPNSRSEQILLCCINKHGKEHCEPPNSNNELLLQALAEKIKEGASSQYTSAEGVSF